MGQRLQPRNMTFPVRAILLVAFLNQILSSICLPTTTITVPDKSSPFVTELDDGEVIVALPEITAQDSVTSPSRGTYNLVLSASKSSIRYTDIGLSSGEGALESMDEPTPSTQTGEEEGNRASELPVRMHPTTKTGASLLNSPDPSLELFQYSTMIVKESSTDAASEETTNIATQTLTSVPTPTKVVSITAILSSQRGSMDANGGIADISGSQVDTPSSFSTIFTPDDDNASPEGTGDIGFVGKTLRSSPLGPSEAGTQDQLIPASSTYPNEPTHASTQPVLFTDGIGTSSPGTSGTIPVRNVPHPNSSGPSGPGSQDELQIASFARIEDTSSLTKGHMADSALDSNKPTSSSQNFVSTGPSPIGAQPSLPTSTTEPGVTGSPLIAGMPILPGPAETLPSGKPVASQGPEGTLPQPKIPIPDGPPTPGFILPTADSVPDNIPVPGVNLPKTTQTTAPPGYSLEVVSDAAWKSDTVITTNVQGTEQPTVVPVFANCDGCGPEGALVVLGAFKPDISYDLPKIPGLPSVPSFYMPCVLLCGSPSGGKPGPPVRKDGGGRGDDEDGNNDDTDDNDDENSDDDDDDNDSGDDDDHEDDDQDDDEEEGEDEGDDDEDEDEDEDDDEQQSTGNPTTQPSTTTTGATTAASTGSGPSSTSFQSSVVSSSTGTKVPMTTDTIYIDKRSTDVQAPDEEMNLYLRSAYSSLGYLDDEDDTLSAPATTSAMPASSLIDIFPAPSAVSSKIAARPIWPSSLAPSIFAKVSSTSSSIVSSSLTPSSTTEEGDEEAPPAEATDEIECHGVSGDIWIERDRAVAGAYEFCNQDDTEKEYVLPKPPFMNPADSFSPRFFEGTDDHIKFSLTNNGSPDPNPDLPRWLSCYVTFMDLIDHCDGNDPDNNPHNYKFGGTNSTRAGREYHWEPLALKEIDQRCEITWKGLYNVFEIRGKWFPDDLFGEDGSGLRDEIEGCGAVTRWSFKWTPDDVKFQWYATGRYFVVKTGCLGRAMVSAGGNGYGNCGPQY